MKYQDWFVIRITVEPNFATDQIVHTAKLTFTWETPSHPPLWCRQMFDIHMEKAAQDEFFMNLLDAEFHHPLLRYFDDLELWQSEQTSRPTSFKRSY